jgi:hypothetical protein
MWKIGKKISVALLAALSATSACDSATKPNRELPEAGEVHLQVSGDRFFWSRDGLPTVAIPYVYESPCDEILTFVTCGCGEMYGLERWNGQSWDWVELGLNYPSCLCLDPEQIEEREIRRRTAHVSAVRTDEPFGLSEDRLSGIFRLVLASLYFDWDDSGDWGEEVPHEYRVSNPFWLEFE